MFTDLEINKNEDKIINYKISLLKYSLFEKIDNLKIPYLIDEIFELGYSYYIKNLIKVDLQNQNTNSITESKLSANKGYTGENIVMDILIDRFNSFQIENTSKIPHSGDIQITLPSYKKIIVEVKNYNKTIDQDEIDKLKFDMKFNKITAAIFISLNSGIVGKKRFELEIFSYELIDYYIIYIPYSMHKTLPNKKNIITHNNIEDSITNLTIRLEFGICIIQNIIEKFKNNIYNKNIISNIDLDIITYQLNSIYEEFKLVKNSAYKLEENIKKNFENHSNSIKEFENIIIKKINKIIKNKIYSENNFEKKKIKLKLNNYSNWNILINNKIYGMIIKINDIYDLFLNYNNVLIDKKFIDFKECKKYLKNL